MKITCEKCNSQYNIDETRVPPSGLRMQCTKCTHTFTVEKPKTAVPSAVKPPALSYQVKRKSGRTFGPFLEPALVKMLKEGTLVGNEEISIDGKVWKPLSSVPAFAQLGKAPAPAAPPPPEEAPDLPTPRQPPPRTAAAPPELADLPRPKGGAQAPSSPFDGGIDLPRPKGGAQAPSNPFDGGIDLPRPKGGAQPPSSPFDGGIDLPAPKARGASSGDGRGLLPDEFSDLPAPKLGGAELPTPKRGYDGGIDLPAPKRGSDGGIDLPAPKGAELPTPKGGGYGGIVDLPTPKQAELPAPKDLVDLPALKDLVDLPTPRDSIELPTPKAHELPTPKTHELPKPKPTASISDFGGGDALELEGGLDFDPEPENEFDDLAAAGPKKGTLAANPPPPRAGAPNPSPPRAGAQQTKAASPAPIPASRAPATRPPAPTTGTATKAQRPGTLPAKPAAPTTDDLSLEDFDVVPATRPPGKPVTGLSLAASRGEPMLEMPGLELDNLSLEPPPDQGLDTGLSFSMGGDTGPAPQGIDAGLSFSSGGPSLDLETPSEAPEPPPSGLTFKTPGAAGSAAPAADETVTLARPITKPKVEEPVPEPVKLPTPERRAPRRSEKPPVNRTMIYAILLIAAAGTAGGLWWKHRLDAKREAREKLAAAIQGGRKLMNGDAPDRFKQASMAFDRVLKQKPDDIEAKVLAGEAALADAVLRGGDAGAAGKGKRLIGEAQAAAAPSTDLKRAKALRSLLSGQLGAARGGFKSIGHDADALLFLGLTELYANRGPAAVAALSEAQKMRPKRSEVLVPLARAQVLAGDKDGIDVLAAAADKAPDDLRVQLALLLAKPNTPMSRAAKLQAVMSADKSGGAPLDSGLAWSVVGRQLLSELRYNDADLALTAAQKGPITLPITKVVEADFDFAKEKYDDAKKAYDEAVTLDGGALDPILGRVRFGISRGQLDDAKKDLDTASALDNGDAAKDAHVVFWKGRLAEAQKDDAAALKLYAEAMGKDTDFLDPYLRDAQLLRARHQDKEANDVLAQAGDRASKNPQAMLTLAAAYMDAGELGAAEERLKKATLDDTTRLTANMRLGALYEKQENLEAARQAYQAAYTSAPTDADAAIALIHLSVATDHVDDARKVITDFLAASKTPPARMLAEAVLMEYRSGNLDAVKKIGEQLHQEDPNSAVWLFVRGTTIDASKPGAIDEAVLALKNALALDSRPEFHYAYARALTLAKRNDEALEEYNAALHGDETYADARAAVAEYLISKQRFVEAKVELAKLIKQRPKVARYVRLAGDIAFEANDTDNAFAAYQQALALDPKDAEVHFRLAKIFSSRDKPRDVIASLQKAVQFADKDKDTWLPEAYRTLGYALKDAGKKGDAIAAFRKVVEIDPGGSDAREAENQLAILGAQ